MDRGHRPWTNALVITSPDGGDVAYTTRGGFFYEEPDPRAGEQGPSWPNANLMAASPDLYKAGKELKGAVCHLVMSIVMGQPLGDVEARVNAATDAMTAALRKAEGQS